MIKLIKSELAGRKGVNGQCLDLKGGSLSKIDENWGEIMAASNLGE